MAPANLPNQVTLLYGNQGFSVDKTAKRLADVVLGDSPREFSFHRFDVADLLKPAAGEGAVSGLEEFHTACQTVPMLCERHLVQLDHLERVRPSDRQFRKLTQLLATTVVHRIEWQGREAWALVEELPAPQPQGVRAALERWVGATPGGPKGRLVLEIAPGAPEFLVGKGPEARLVDAQTFLQLKVKGNYFFAGEGVAATEHSAAGTGGARLHQLLERLIENPPPGCWLVLTAAATRESELSSTLLSLIKKRGTIEKFVTYDEYEPVDWVRKVGREKGLTISRETAEELIQLAGNDHGNLERELEKLSLIHPPGATVKREALAGAVSAQSQFSPFTINERLGAKDLAGALNIMERFLRFNSNDFPVMIGIMARYFRQLLHIHALRGQGVQEPEMATRIKLHPFIARKLAAQAARFGEVELERIVAELARLDVALRQHGPLMPVLLKNFLERVCVGNFSRQGLYRSLS